MVVCQLFLSKIVLKKKEEEEEAESSDLKQQVYSLVHSSVGWLQGLSSPVLGVGQFYVSLVFEPVAA